jgi:peptidoglycan/LPS O-acetylase OafA/YrhL
VVNTVSRQSASLPVNKRIPELDGLRGIAILLVLVYHCLSLPIAERWPNPLSYVKYATRLGWTGVDLFFVLSGFLIGGILLEARDSPRYYRVFYFRRACRILPAYFAYLLLILVFYFYFFSFHQNQMTMEEFQPAMPWFSYLTFTQNFWMTARQALGAPALNVTWSLAVEEQFYLTLPTVIRKVSLRSLPYVLGGGIIGALILRLALLWKVPHADIAVFTLLPCRMDSLLLGVLLVFLLRKPSVWGFLAVKCRPWLWALLGVLSLGMIYFNTLNLQQAAFPVASIGFDWIALFYGTIMVLALTQSRSFLSNILRTRWLMALGSIAYLTYLIHTVVRYFFMNAVRHHGNIHWSAGDLVVSFLSIGLSIGIAQISWLFFEKRLVDWGHRLRY